MAFDITKYCLESDEDWRKEIQTPFSIDDNTYATNGHILVRVARMEEWPSRDDAPKSAVDLIAKADKEPLSKLPKITIPKETHCQKCDGSGEIFICPHCASEDVSCPDCRGAGSQDRRFSVEIGEEWIALQYYRKIAALKKPSIVLPAAVSGDPIYFSFDGGEGLIMPQRKHGYWPKDHEVLPPAPNT